MSGSLEWYNYMRQTPARSHCKRTRSKRRNVSIRISDTNLLVSWWRIKLHLIWRKVQPRTSFLKLQRIFLRIKATRKIQKWKEYVEGYHKKLWSGINSLLQESNKDSSYSKVRSILSGEETIRLNLEFLYRNNHADLLILKNTKVKDNSTSKFVNFADIYVSRMPSIRETPYTTQPWPLPMLSCMPVLLAMNFCARI